MRTNFDFYSALQLKFSAEHIHSFAIANEGGSTNNTNFRLWLASLCTMPPQCELVDQGVNIIGPMIGRKKMIIKLQTV